MPKAVSAMPKYFEEASGLFRDQLPAAQCRPVPRRHLGPRPDLLGKKPRRETAAGNGPLVLHVDTRAHEPVQTPSRAGTNVATVR